ncbi:hypothetical protein BT63DRAFT_423073 [Microthyrium microscopicum]|uniref:Uncharacterized protein n=1 Tax=Microthyrium microscopicum TaxID=703497 RepID=A0A6A6UI85_9PEZI|nr:hypothetical protein BT63DRAFT_423073 [Microthyrium microscopicum]
MTSPTSTNSSLSSSQRFQRFGLDDRSTKKIMVYNHPHGLITSSQQDLCKMIDSDPNLRVSRVPIPWGNSSVSIRQRDLIPADERASISDKPSMNLSLASINLGRLGHLKRMVGLQRELYVVSPESSPNSSPDNSQHVSPNSTFAPENKMERQSRPEHDSVAAGADRVQF